MPHTTNVSIRMDDELKKQAENLFDDLGLNMTTAITIFIKQAIAYGGIPFEVRRLEPFFSDHNQQVLRRSIAQLDAGSGITHDTAEIADD